MHQPSFVIALVAAVACSWIPGARAEETRALGSGLGLFVDDWLIDAASMKSAGLKLHSPIPRGITFNFDQPWEGGQSAYVTLIKDGARYIMYYRGGGDLVREYTCLATSEDGERWTRPKLGLVEFNGSKDNNIFWTGPRKAYAESHNFSPFKDANPACKKEEIWKAVTVTRFEVNKERRNALIGLISADGIHWKHIREEALITDGAFDSHNVAFWDVVQKQYVCYSRAAQQGKKSVNRCTSKDFLNWGKAELLNFGDTPVEHFYTNGIVQYERQPEVYLGFPMRFIHPKDRDYVGFDKRKTDGLSDAVFMSSHDGRNWNRPFMEAWIRPGLDPKNWGGAHGNMTPAWGLLQTGDTELSVYWAEHYDNYPKKDLIPRLIRGTLRLDGFVSVNAPYAGGEFTTRPLTFTGKNLVLNCSTSAPGSIKVEIQDAAGKPMPGYTMADCDEIWGDEIERMVGWKAGHDVGRLAGKPIRLRFALKDADLYTIRFKP